MIINLPSTVEMITERLRRHHRVDANISRRDSVLLSLHPHNDAHRRATAELGYGRRDRIEAACSATASAPATSTWSPWG